VASIQIQGIGSVSVLFLIHMFMNIKVVEETYGTYLAIYGSGAAIVVWVQANILKFMRRPSQGLSMELREALALEVISNDCNFVRKMSCKLSEAGNGEQKILVRVHGVVLRRHPCVGVRILCLDGDKSGSLRKMQV
jgi:hypothetical protein